jgi:hypothetical protein
MSTIEKIAVYDARIIQEAPKYAVQKGALAVSVAPFNALAASASQHTYQVLVPSLNVFVDRKMDLRASASVYMEAAPSQYSTIAKTYTVPQGQIADLRVSNPPGDDLAPTATTSFQVGLPLITDAQGGAVDPDILTANSLISLRDIQLSVLTQSAGGLSGALNLTCTFSSGISIAKLSAFVAQNPAGTVRINGTGLTSVVVTAVSTAGVVSLASATTANASGDYTFRVAIAPQLKIQRTVYQDNNVRFYLPAFNGLGVGDLYTLIANTSAAVIDCESGYIATPKLLSTKDVVEQAKEVIKADGSRGFGDNSGYQLPQGSFSGCTGATETNWYQPIGTPVDLSLSMFPIQTLCTNFTASINDCTVTTNGDTLKEQLLFSQTRASLMQRTTPSKFDVFAWSPDDIQNNNGNFQTYSNTKDSDIPNGAWSLEFVNPNTGASFKQFDFYATNNPLVPTVTVINYRPVFIPYGSSLVGKTITVGASNYVIQPSPMIAIPVMFRFSSQEPLCLSPFLWQDAKEMTEVGLYGCTNMSLTFNLQSAGPTIGYDTLAVTQGKKYFVDRLSTIYPSHAGLVRASGTHALYSNVRLQSPVGNAGTSFGPFTNPKLFVTFLTPPPDVTLPLVSTVPYMEFPRYFSPATLSANRGEQTLNSNTITLSSIPDILAVFVKPMVRGQTQNETYVPILKAGITFDNYSNLCSNFAQEDLYCCSVAAGLDMDWQQWRGYTNAKTPTLRPVSSASNSVFDLRDQSPVTQTTGGPLLLRMGQDVPLSAGLAPGTLGNYSVQVTLTVDNQYGFFDHVPICSTGANCNIIIMALNSGFFETIRGQSAIRKTILNSVDVESASVQSGITTSQLRRLVGGEAPKSNPSSNLTAADIEKEQPVNAAGRGGGKGGRGYGLG